MKRALRDKWLVALRSGEYPQARHALSREQGSSYCCIGVLGKVANVSLELDTYTVGEECGLKPTEISVLVDLNDDEGRDFPAIADYVERRITVEEDGETHQTPVG